MNKGILVIDMPESCFDCELRIVDCSLNVCKMTRHIIDRNVLNYTKNYRCPLIPLPQKKEICYPITDGITTVTDSEYTLNDYLFDKGYNTCLDEILGGNNE